MASRADGVLTVALVALLGGCAADTSERVEPGIPSSHTVAPGMVPRPTPPVAVADRPVPLPTPPGQAAAPPSMPPVSMPPVSIPPALAPISAPRPLTPFGPSEPIVQAKRAEPVPSLPPTTVTASPLAMPPEALPGLPGSDDMRVVQETLAEEGLYRGQLDGRWNPELREAVLRYQRRHGLRETAALDPDTLRRLDVPAPSYGSADAGSKPETGGR